MKLAALILLLAIVGKISASPYRYPVRLAYYRAAAPQQLADDDDVSEEEADDVSEEVNFSNDRIQDDDDDSEEQEEPPQFQKLFPLPQQNSPGHNFPLAVMMGEISAQGWKVPKRPQVEGEQEKRARAAITIARDDDDDSDEDDDDDEDEEEDDEPEDDLPEWGKLFPNLEEEANAGPPAGLLDTSSAPELPASFRSGLGGSRLVYVPARQLRQGRRPIPTQQTVRAQYVMRNQSPPSRSPVVYAMASPSYNRRQQHQPIIQRRPQQIMYASTARRQPQRQQPYVMYMPVRRNSYNPYVSPYVPRYRY